MKVNLRQYVVCLFYFFRANTPTQTFILLTNKSMSFRFIFG
ncbi:hypothetical protein FP735_18370 [Vibrio parahaemolyticus]|nr:hypothetical protein [Vibrio parahaemolyticus]EGQ9297527.1 hypothetical protein [Vibrio parahaemolyticus]NCM79739.1 hypothetical protein [Vibrio parahaemolyticus]HAS6608020.1 hypothetical protein [Vibrio parahaemolyticus]